MSASHEPAPAGTTTGLAAYRRSSPPIVRWRFLDRLTRQHPAGPLLVFVPFIVTLLVGGLRATGPMPVVALVPVGYLSWTLFEYWLHRLLFHWEARPGTAMARVHWAIHGVHHEHPDDPRRLVMPLVVTVPLAAGLSVAFRYALGPTLWFPVGAGFALGYLLYDMIHYHVHDNRPRTRIGRSLRRRHLLHHFDDDRAGFGVSAPWWDVVFCTRGRTARATDAMTP